MDVENEHERLSNFALGHAYPSRANEFTPDFWGGPMLLIFLIFCVV